MNTINKKTKTVIRLFFPWQDAKEEHWLEGMAAQGWQFTRYTFFRYNFTAIQPQEYIYRVDYKSTSQEDMEEYKDIFSQSGWEHVCSSAGWQYLRILKENFSTDIYTDKTSKIEKLRQQSAWALSAIIPMMIFLVIILPRAISAFERYHISFLLPILFVLMLISVIFNAIWLLKLSQRIKELENVQ